MHRSPKAEEYVCEGFRASEQREYDPIHHPFHLKNVKKKYQMLNTPDSVSFLNERFRFLIKKPR